MKAFNLASWACSMLVMGMILQSHADVPRIMNYQGKVATADGSPVPDGVYNLRLKIFDAATGGTQLWDSGTQLVQVRGGVFELLLGQSPQPALTLPFDRDYWIEVTFAGDLQSPRVRICSTGYAFMAAGLVPGTEISGSVSDGARAALAATNTSSTGYVYGGIFTATQSSGAGVMGANSALYGQNCYGVYGYARSSNGYGVYGQNSDGSSGVGVYGFGRTGIAGDASTSSGTGVFGRAYLSTGASFGGDFQNNSNQGTGVRARVYATEGPTCAGEFVASSPGGYAITAVNTAASGYPVSIHCESHSTAGGYALRADALASTGTATGVFGISRSSAGHGVYGWNAAMTTGTNGAAPGVTGFSSAQGGRGVMGAADGVGAACGGYFTAHSSAGLGLVGYSTSSTGTTYGVYGAAPSSTGYAVYAAGNFAASGTKSCVVKTSQGPSMLYCMESPENWFEDFGSGTLVDGRARVEIDPLFLETVTIDEAHPFHVFLQQGGPCGTLYVVKGQTGFDVVEWGGSSTAPFDYRVVARRKGFEARRLDSCEAALMDPHLCPEAKTNPLWSVGHLRSPTGHEAGLGGWPAEPESARVPSRDSGITPFP